MRDISECMKKIICKVFLKITKKRVIELRSPALVCLSAIDKKNQSIGLLHRPES